MQLDKNVKSINNKLEEFDLISLLRLLHYYGISFDYILFQSNDSRVSPVRLIESIDSRSVKGSKNKIIIITLNIGLLGGQALLPEYFFKKLDSINRSGFVSFIRYFDHFLIMNLIKNLYPEINTSFFSNWNEMVKNYLKIQNVHSHVFLHWLFDIVFPEFTVKIKKSKNEIENKAKIPRLGKVRLGRLGNENKLGIFKTVVNLNLVENSVNYFVWHDVLDQIKNRLCSGIFPMLEGYDLCLEIVLKAKPSKIRFYTGLKGQLGSSFFAKSNHRKTTVFKGYPPHNLEQNKSNFERENKWQISL